MKTLFLLRHAKSSWDHSSAGDHERPLAPRGIRAAPLMGAHMREAGYRPDLILCSTATRTRETCAAVAAELDVHPPIDFDESLYLGAPHHLLETVREAPESADAILMIGHNPGTELLAEALCAHGSPAELDLMNAKFPTAALAVIDLDIDRWEEACTDCGRLRSFTRPKDLE